ncbi:HAD-IIIA family hydrolase [Candidatus Margulisiibacteriota bacterium]
MKVVIVAGGKGTRLQEIAKDIPKAMVPLLNKPLLEYQIELAKRYGFKDILLLTGYLGEKIKDHFQDGKKYGVKINYHEEKAPLGTAGCFAEVADLLREDFFVFYGDTMFDIDLKKMLAFHKKHRSKGTLFLHPNDHPIDSDLVAIDNKNKEITNFYPKPRPSGFYRNLVNAALYILSPDMLKYIAKGKAQDFGKDIFPKALQAREKMCGYVSTEYIKDLGTPERYKKVEQSLRSGKVSRSNSHNKQVAVFLDRDGTINKDINLLHTVEEMELLPNAAQAIKKLNTEGILAIVVTNQPVIARNLVDIKGLNEIHNKMESLLGAQGAYVDAIYFCPHHPDAGYSEERKEFKIKCNCRKPKPGMLKEAAKEFNIDLKRSYIVGDRGVDIEAGKVAGLRKTALVKINQEIDYTYESADINTDSLMSAVEIILKDIK